MGMWGTERIAIQGFPLKRGSGFKGADLRDVLSTLHFLLRVQLCPTVIIHLKSRVGKNLHLLGDTSQCQEKRFGVLSKEVLL